jgi:hypothetical protein
LSDRAVRGSHRKPFGASRYDAGEQPSGAEAVSRSNPFWIAQRQGQKWRDESVLAAIDWLTSFTDSRDWSRRMDGVRRDFEEGQQAWAAGERRLLFDPKDGIAWYVFQASAYAAVRQDWFEPEAFRITPVFRRLGQLMPELKMVTGIEDRVSHLMNAGKSQADDNLFELLVAGAYQCRSWNAEFAQARPGIAQTHDLTVSSGRRRWAVECKRVNRSGYEAAEYEHGLRLAKPVHKICREKSCSLVIEVIYDVQLSEVGDTHLAERVEAFLDDPRRGAWSDPLSRGQVRHVDWRLAREVLEHDDVFFGSSRMVELLVGTYEPDVDHDVAADWTPAPERPLHATAVSRASVVSWRSASMEAARRKARHFKSIVAKAEKQLPDDCPGVVHVGYEARDGNSVDDLRHWLNSAEMKTFAPNGSRLRWVYGNYLSPEHVNARDESCALSETTAAYKIGRHRTLAPLPCHLLFHNGGGRRGVHW